MRCAYCHDDDERVSEGPGCPRCDARLHRECWTDVGGRCPSLYCPGRVVVRPRWTPAPAPARPGPGAGWRVLHGLGAAILSVATAVGVLVVYFVFFAGILRSARPTLLDYALLIVTLALHLVVVPAAWGSLLGGRSYRVRLVDALLGQLVLSPVLGGLFMAVPIAAVTAFVWAPWLALSVGSTLRTESPPRPLPRYTARRPDTLGRPAIGHGRASAPS